MGLVNFYSPDAVAQQLPEFSQYIFNGVNINPAYAGYKYAGYVQTTYKSRWNDFPGSPKTFSLTGDFSINDDRMGVGGSVMTDRLGPTSITNLLFIYSYNLQLGSDSYLRFGASGGGAQYMIDGDMLEYNDPDDPSLPQGRITLFTPTFNSGLFFHTGGFYAGISAFNLVGKKALLKEDIALGFHDIHYFFTMGGMLDLSNSVQLMPSFLIREIRGAPTSVDLNAMFRFNDRFMIGGSYRSAYAIGKSNLEDLNLNPPTSLSLLFEFFATENLRIGYAYDKNLNAIDNFGGNSHEVSLGFYLFGTEAYEIQRRRF